MIRLIPKKDKDLTQLKNWRPISLQNIDIKIVSLCLARRLQKVLPNIIDNDQNGFIKNRFIGYNIHLRFRIIPKQNAFFPKNKMRLDATGRN